MNHPQISTEHSVRKIVVLSAGISEPSSTRLLAHQVDSKVTEMLRARGHSTVLDVVELRTLARHITAGITTGLIADELKTVFTIIAEADGLIVSTPVYKAGISGLLKAFIDLWENDLVIAKPVLLLATAGTPRHALVVDDQLRSLFAYLRSLTVPTSVFAASADWNSAELTERITRAAHEFSVLVSQDIAQKLLADSWNSYRRDFDSQAQQAAGEGGGINLDSDLMKLAAGGAL